MDHLCRETGAADRRIVVLGAGNCNDLDLARLSAGFAEVHLVDWDEEAVRVGIERQLAGNPLAARVHVHVTDVAARPEENETSELARGIGPADVVASVCLLSQIIGHVVEGCQGVREREIDAIREARREHIQLMLDLLRPAGVGMLFIDLVSSDTAPALLTMSEGQLGGWLVEQINAGNFFTGLNPAILEEQLRTEAAMASQIVEHQLVKPWRWSLGRRAYAVYALKFRKRG
jgi:hypothetical protein